MTPRLLDLFCGAGGAAMGYHLAGFEVVGVDLVPQPAYPFVFICADAMTYPLDGYAVIHASPPCQAYSVLKGRVPRDAPRMIEAVRARLHGAGVPYVIENVVGAPLRDALTLCGSMFQLRTSCEAALRRHRRFESNVLLMSPGPCDHGPAPRGVVRRRRTIMVVGASPRDPALERRKYHTRPRAGEQQAIRETFSVGEARRAMGISWMTMAELSQAIPPAYTEYIGQQLVAFIKARSCASEETPV